MSWEGGTTTQSGACTTQSANDKRTQSGFRDPHARFLSPAHLHVTAPEFSPDLFGGDEYVMRICFFRCATRSLLGGRDLRHVLLDLRYSRLELCVGEMLVGLLREGGDQRLHFFDGVIEGGRLRARGIARRAEVGELRLVFVNIFCKNAVRLIFVWFCDSTTQSGDSTTQSKRKLPGNSDNTQSRSSKLGNNFLCTAHPISARAAPPRLGARLPRGRCGRGHE